MKIVSSGKKVELLVDESIGEKNDLYFFKANNFSEVTLDLSLVKVINSIGIKNWINWIMSIPETINIILKNAPHILVNQASTIAGFVPKNSRIESLFVFYACDKCNKETAKQLFLGQHYFYGTPEQKYILKLPDDVKCDKCGQLCEPDFLPDKIFKFLDNQAKA